jgi:hypothetical protein
MIQPSYEFIFFTLALVPNMNMMRPSMPNMNMMRPPMMPFNIPALRNPVPPTCVLPEKKHSLGPKAEKELDSLFDDKILDDAESTQARSKIFDVLGNESEEIQVWIIKDYRKVHEEEKDAAVWMKDKLCTHKRAAAHSDTPLPKLNKKYYMRLSGYLSLRNKRSDITAVLMNMSEKQQKQCILKLVKKNVGYQKKTNTIKYKKVMKHIVNWDEATKEAEKTASATKRKSSGRKSKKVVPAFQPSSSDSSDSSSSDSDSSEDEQPVKKKAKVTPPKASPAPAPAPTATPAPVPPASEAPKPKAPKIAINMDDL